MLTAIINSPLGKLEINGDSSGLGSIIYLDSEEAVISKSIPSELKKVISQLEEYFKKERTEFDVKLAPKGTEFQLKVWRELQKILTEKLLVTNKLQISWAIQR